MKFLITAGPTREPLDPVRYLTNRSSGKMGYAIAEAAVAAGHEVCLVSGPTNLAEIPGVRRVCVETAQEMFAAVQAEISTANVAVFSAAVADYRPAVLETQKIKKTDSEFILRLERTPDILGSTRSVFGYKGVLVGFAAETQDLVQNSVAKLTKKGCDFLIANDVSRKDIGFDGDDNEIHLFRKDGSHESWQKLTKREIGRKLVALVTQACT